MRKLSFAAESCVRLFVWLSSGWPPDIMHPCQGLVCDHGIVRFSNTSPVSLLLNRQAEKKASTSAVTKHANARREEAAGVQSQYKGVTATNERRKHGHCFRQEQTSTWFYGRTEMPDPAGEKTCSPVSLLSDYRYFIRCRCKKAFRAFQLSDQDRSRSKIYRYRNCKG